MDGWIGRQKHRPSAYSSETRDGISTSLYSSFQDGDPAGVNAGSDP